MVFCNAQVFYYIIPSDNWEQQRHWEQETTKVYYIIPSDNWEQQQQVYCDVKALDYIIPSDNWEQQRGSVEYL